MSDNLLIKDIDKKIVQARDEGKTSMEWSKKDLYKLVDYITANGFGIDYGGVKHTLK